MVAWCASPYLCPAHSSLPRGRIKRSVQAERLSLKVDGRTQALNIERETPLLYALRNDLGLNGPKFGCGLAQRVARNIVCRLTSDRRQSTFVW